MKGKNRKRRIHGFSSHRLYAKRRDIINRCYNKNVERYESYGGRGIRVCKEWLDYPGSFVRWALNNGWEEGLTIERKDIDGDYGPDNCSFITPREQHYNKTNSLIVKFKGKVYCFAELIYQEFNNENYTRAYATIWSYLKRNNLKELPVDVFNRYKVKYCATN